MATLLRQHTQNRCGSGMPYVDTSAGIQWGTWKQDCQRAFMRKNWLLLPGVVASVTCLFAQNIADYDHSVNFGKYHT
jgi:hypothetical protein